MNLPPPPKTDNINELKGWLEDLYTYIKGPIILDSAVAIYWGIQGTNGSWRIIRSGDNLSVQRLEAGSWVEKGNFIP